MSRLDLNKPPREGHAFIDIVTGREGPCVCIGDHNGGMRVAGPKPWGGGTTQHRFEVPLSDLRRALEMLEPQQPAPARVEVPRELLRQVYDMAREECESPMAAFAPQAGQAGGEVADG